MGQIQNNNEDRDKRIFIDKFERVENECKRLRRMLPEGMVVMVLYRNDLSFFLEGLQAAPLFFVLEDDETDVR